MLRVERFVDVDELSARHEHFADPAGARPGQSGNENRWPFLSECTVGHYCTLFLAGTAKVPIYRSAWMDLHVLVTVSLNRQSWQALAELLFTHQ
jgi:hypothetical protein